MNSRELKAVRLVTQRRVHINYRNDDVTVGIVWGDHDLYKVETDPEGDRCECPTYGTCSHLIALKLETRRQNGLARISRSRRTSRVETRNDLGVHVEGDAPRTGHEDRKTEALV